MGSTDRPTPLDEWLALNKKFIEEQRIAIRAAMERNRQLIELVFSLLEEPVAAPIVVESAP